jgi:hypothetical protein
MPWETVIATVFQAGNRVVINGAGFFVYAGAPTLGNLLATIANAGGVDQFGNTYVPGITIYNGSQFFNINDVPPPTANMVTGAASEDEPATLFADITNTGLANEFITLFLTGPSSSFDDERAVIQLISSKANGSSPLANGGLYVFQGSTQLSNPVTWTADTGNWHNMTLLNGWRQASGWATCRYRLTPLNEIEIQGALTNSGGPSSFTFAQLPTGYRPTNQGLYQALPSTTSAITGAYYGLCDTSGNLTIFGNAISGTVVFPFEGIFPLN